MRPISQPERVLGEGSRLLSVTQLGRGNTEAETLRRTSQESRLLWKKPGRSGRSRPGRSVT